MLEQFLNILAFTFHLPMFCAIIKNVWWDISNSYMARGYLTFLWIFQKKLHLQLLSTIAFSKSQNRQRVIAFILVNTIQYLCTLKNDIYHSHKRVPLPFFHSYTNLVFGHVLIHSFDKTHVLIVTVELTWLLLLNIVLSFNFVPRPNKLLLG